jgi:hypothetical protein
MKPLAGPSCGRATACWRRDETIGVWDLAPTSYTFPLPLEIINKTACQMETLLGQRLAGQLGLERSYTFVLDRL